MSMLLCSPPETPRRVDGDAHPLVQEQGEPGWWPCMEAS